MSFVVTAPNGKKYKINAPPGATKDQVLAYAQQQFGKPQVSQDEPYSAAAETGSGEAFLVGAGKKGKDIWAGMQQLRQRADEYLHGPNRIPGAEWMANPQMAAARMAGLGPQIDKAIATNRATLGEYERKVIEDLKLYGELRKDKPWATGGGELATEILAFAPAPLAKGGFMVKAGASALSGAMQQGVQFAADDEARANNMQAGAIGGVLGTALVSALGKGINAVRGVFSDAKLAKTAQQLNDLGIPVTYADLKGDAPKRRLIGTVDEFLSKIPFLGTAGIKGKQAEALTSALNRLRDKYAAELSETTDEAGTLLQRQLIAAQEKAKGEAGRLYDDVATEAAKINKPVMTSDFARHVNQMLNADKGLAKVAQDPRVVAVLEEFQGTNVLDFTSARALRKKIGNMVTRSMRADGVPSDMTPKLTILKEALERDIDNFGRQAGGSLSKAMRAAADFYKSKVVPFKKHSDLRRIVNDPYLADSTVKSMLKDGRTHDVRELYRAAGDDGKRTIEYSIIDDAIERATIRAGDKQFISPGSFSGIIGKYKNMIRDLPRERVAEIGGAARLMSHMRSVDDFMKRKQTGMGALQQTVPFVGGGSLVAGMMNVPVATTGVVTGMQLFKMLFSTDKGRRYLMAASDMQPGSKQMQLLWESVKKSGESGGAGLMEDLTEP